MYNCKDCAHSIFDEKWGEYKCKKHQRTVYILLDAEECPSYEKEAKPKTFKEEEE